MTDFRVMIAGGGTGGHLFPGIAVAEQVRAAGGTVRFVGTERGIEARVLPEQGWPLDLVEVVGIKGRGLGGLLRGLAKLPGAYLASRRLIRAFEPHVVVGVGGYASGPIVMTARSVGIPTAILEQNSVPGITNRLLGKVVHRVYGMFPDDRGFFPARKFEVTGNPIRAELVARLGAVTPDATPHPPRLFVFGGSQGARPINEAMMEAAAALHATIPGLEVIHQTGETDAARVAEAYAAAGFGPRARVHPFIRDMTEPYGWCDLVVCRAGATSLAELAAVGCPAVLVPFPQATDDHQTHNARFVVDAGGAVLLPQDRLGTESLVATLEATLADPARLAQMRSAMHGVARPRAAAEIYDRLVELAGV